MNETAAKFTLTCLLAALSVWIEILVVPVILLVLSMALDYVTGLMAASNRGNAITSYRSINGIAKKICSLLLVVVGLILDCLVVYAREAFGLSFPWSFIIAALIAVWLTINEVISILENIQDIGGNIPSWLLPLVKNIQTKVELISPDTKKEENSNAKD